VNIYLTQKTWQVIVLLRDRPGAGLRYLETNWLSLKQSYDSIKGEDGTCSDREC